jgi:DNA polymerase-3 subunit gamma/tau
LKNFRILQENQLSDNQYLVFTRKWRPQLFEDVVGQEQVTKPLRRAIEQNRIMHAYLFSGPRGVGKTTTARVFAKALNCEKGPTSEPCNECESCRSIIEGNSLDVIEIDGASNRGIDEIRELREHIGLASAHSRYKVYIIDEVHMLTKEAFNALLKTLEEPPKHVIFIFATTDPQNIPQTILSRCQHFRFRRMPVNLIVQNLKMIAGREKAECDEEAYYMIARAADGALRDGQRIFDQAVTYARDEKITTGLTAEMLGEIDTDLLNRLLASIIGKDIKGGVTALESVFEKGYDLKRFLEDIVEALRNMLIIKTVDAKDIIEAGDEEYDFLKKMAAVLTKENILYMLQKSLGSEQLLLKTSMPGIVMEALVADLIFSLGDGKAELDIQLPVKKEAPRQAPAPQKNEEAKAAAPQEEPGEITSNAEPDKQPGMMLVDEIVEEEKITKITKDVIERHWDNIIERIKSREEMEELAQAMATAGVVSYEEPNLMLTGENKFFTDRIQKNAEFIKEILREEFKKDFAINIYEKNEYLAKHKAKKDVAEEEAKNHPTVKELSRIFKISSVEVKNHPK